MKLGDVRRVRRLSVEQLADLAEVNPTTIRNIEAGEHKPRMNTVQRLEKALGVNGQMIEEFWPVLGEPENWVLKQYTPGQLADSVERLRQGPTSTAMSREEFWQWARQLEGQREEDTREVMAA